MARLIDTSVFVALERREQPVANELDQLGLGEEIAISTLTATELLLGVERAESETRRARRAAFIESVFTSLPVLPFDLPSARKHAQLRAILLGSGRMIGAYDLLIAASALAYGYSVVTLNLGDFQRVPGLTVHRPNW